MDLQKTIIEFVEKKRFFMKVIFYFCLIGVAVLAFIPGTPPGIGKVWDKANHAFAFMVLSFLGLIAYLSSVTKISMIRISLILMSYGVFIELVQFFLPFRQFSFKDMAADFVGILIGVIFFVLSGIRKEI